jgi:eukaryotic-like serine/threonine-protein kinase
MLGTPLYTAPEQAAADPGVDRRADLYALGAVAYEMLSGAPPFGGRSSPQQLLVAHLVEKPEPVSASRPDCPPALAALVMRCLEKRPDDRPQTADEVLRELETVTTAGGGQIRAVAPTARRRLRRVAVAAAVGAGVAIAAVSFTITARSHRPPALNPERVVVAPFENRTGDRSLDPLGVMAADWVSQGLSETGLVQVVDARTAIASAASPRATRTSEDKT